MPAWEEVSSPRREPWSRDSESCREPSHTTPSFPEGWRSSVRSGAASGGSGNGSRWAASRITPLCRLLLSVGKSDAQSVWLDRRRLLQTASPITVTHNVCHLPRSLRPDWISLIDDSTDGRSRKECCAKRIFRIERVCQFHNRCAAHLAVVIG